MSTVIAVRRNHTYGLTVDLEVMTCPVCGIVYGIPKDFADSLRRAGRPAHYYCPNGDDLGWSESEADRERKRAVAAERRAATERESAEFWRDRAANERRSAAAIKGHLTRARKRIANGVCPVPGCKRAGFTQVMDHIATQHPDWLHAHPEVNGGDVGTDDAMTEGPGKE